MFVQALERLRPVRGLAVPARYLLTTLIVLVFFALRYALDGILYNYPYLLFFPAIILAAFIFDRGSGFLAVALSAALALYFFVTPRGAFDTAHVGELVAFGIFTATGLLLALLIEALRETFDRLGAEHEALLAANHALDAARRDLSDSFALLDRIIEATPDPIFVKDREGVFVHVNTALAGVFGVPKHVILGRRDRDFVPEDIAEQIERHDRRIMAERRAEQVEERVGRPGGERRAYASVKAPWFGPTGEVLGVIGTARDIHDAKTLERRLRDADARNRLLLDDINHRIKNHMQAVAGLLGRAARRAETLEAARAELEAGAGRLSVLARVYDRLHVAREQTVVDARDFLKRLCDDLAATVVGEKPVAIRAEAEDAPLSSSQAVSIGLIVNELVTNALKYAFPADRAGQVVVGLARHGDRLRLTVADDGIGLPGAPVAGAGAGGGSGQRLVRALAAQLGGTAEWSSTDGVAVRVTMPTHER